MIVIEKEKHQQWQLKRLQKFKRNFLDGFLKQDCFKVLAVLFTIINQVFFVAIISFSLIITIIVAIIIVFLILILFILFSNYYYIFYQVLLLFHYFSVLFFFRLFISHFEFIFVPFSSFIYFFAIFVSLCASNESIKCFICMLLFLILSSLAFVNPPRRTPRSSELSGKLKSLFAFVVVLLLVLSWTIYFIHHLHISHNAPFLPSKIFHNLCFSFILGITAVSKETENNA